MSESALEAYRQRLRAWLKEHVPRDWRKELEGATAEQTVEWDRRWLRELAAGGYAAPTWPREYGGAGASLAEEIVLFEEMARADAPWPEVFFVALNHAGHTIIHCGDERQKAHLPRILAGEQIWCQAFSEPGAGSDLAALEAFARREGDHYVVNGQKVWSSNALHADRAILLARTDREAPKRRGISYFLLDMRSPGVEVRPIRQMTGSFEFCEIFLNDVVVPVSDRVGAENEGWKIARTTLSSERGPGFLRFVTLLRRTLDGVLDLVREKNILESPPPELVEVRQLLANLCCEVELVEQITYRVLHGLQRTGGMGPEASIIKLFHSETNQRLTELAARIEGLSGQLGVARGWEHGAHQAHWVLEHLRSYGYMFGGGTNEIQRNLIAEGALGLPRDPAQR